MLALVIKLTLAHLLGDFLFQPDAWIKDKNNKLHKSKYLYFHIFVHFVLLLIVLQFDIKYVLILIFVPLTHYAIDLSKLILSKKIEAKKLFLADQVLHFMVIGFMVNIYEPYKIDFAFLSSTKVLLLFTTLVCLTYVSSVVIKILMSKWKMESESSNDAGKYIGMMERLFIFVFIALNKWEGVGFLLTAKSVFRFGDLTKHREIKLTEYILIGTLVSFGIAILIALSYKKLLKLI